MSAVPNTKEGEWERSVNIEKDLLRIFEQGLFHDCVFQVASEKGGDSKKFKCHKVILSARSNVFEKMLFGHFLESQMGRDEPIPLFGVTPEVFECAMRFVYGLVKEFKNAVFAMEVYRFAHQMHLTSLMDAVNEFFAKSPISATGALEVLSVCLQTNNHKSLKICTEVLENKTAEAFKSDTWLTVPVTVVQEVLRMDRLDASEPEVVAALLRWGTAQASGAGDDRISMRQKLDPCLNLIRYNHLKSKQFSELCKGDFGHVLSGEEKYQILDCIMQNDWKSLPAHLGPIKTATQTNQASQKLRQVYR